MKKKFISMGGWEKIQHFEQGTRVQMFWKR